MGSREQTHGVRAIRKTSPKTRGRIPTDREGRDTGSTNVQAKHEDIGNGKVHTSHVDRSRWMDSMDLSYSLQDNGGSYTNTKPRNDTEETIPPFPQTTVAEECVDRSKKAHRRIRWSAVIRPTATTTARSQPLFQVPGHEETSVSHATRGPPENQGSVLCGT